MNELDIRDAVDKLLAKAENELDTIFSRALRDILAELSDLYTRHAVRGIEPSFTSLNRYNRVHSMLKRITETMNEEYQEVTRAIHKMSENVYMETFLKTHYLLQVYQQEYYGFTIPTTEVLLAAIANPIELLTLPKVMEVHRNQIVRDLQLIIEQGLRHGRGYSDIAYEIERQLGFSKNKARTVARTEAGRVRAVASELVYMEAGEKFKNARVEKIWCATLDHRTRFSHRRLDFKKANKDGYFIYGANRTTMPLLWEGPQSKELSINCRCTVISKINGKIPILRRGKDTTDPKYQAKVDATIDKLMAEGDTYAKALRQALKEVNPPSKTFEYISYNEWFKRQTM